MNFEFYLFKVSNGQSVACKIPDGGWLLFDLGIAEGFSPVKFIKGVSDDRNEPFSLLKTTVSHLHGSHISDFKNLKMANPAHVDTVKYDIGYLGDIFQTNDMNSANMIIDFYETYGAKDSFTIADEPDFGEVTLEELSLPLSEVRTIGGDANSRVNNSSVVSRISCYGKSFLITGDMETEGWEFALTRSINSSAWIDLVSDVDFLVAPFHGYKDGFSNLMMSRAKPSLVLVSAVSQNHPVDDGYNCEVVGGVKTDLSTFKCLSTLDVEDHIHIVVSENGSFSLGSIPSLDIQKKML